MPILWDEPFGIVMAEAMACGTPVIGFNRGSVPEVVSHGFTGFVVESVDAMARSVRQASIIKRRACRSRVEKSYSEIAITDAYLSTYESMTK
jgi:glycosyltransferase involved in cell wall biosynthesis